MTVWHISCLLYTSAWRIAYCKVYYPLAYYAAFFSIRATAFNYELMCQGKEKLNYFIKDYEKRKDTLTKKEQDTVKDMRIVQEMYALSLIHILWGADPSGGQ